MLTEQQDPYILVMFDPRTIMTNTPGWLITAHPTWWAAADLAGELMDEAVAYKLDIVFVPGKPSDFTPESLIAAVRTEATSYNFGAGA